jgi:hypothetical protein
MLGFQFHRHREKHVSSELKWQRTSMRALAIYQINVICKANWIWLSASLHDTTPSQEKQILVCDRTKLRADEGDMGVVLRIVDRMMECHCCCFSVFYEHSYPYSIVVSHDETKYARSSGSLATSHASQSDLVVLIKKVSKTTHKTSTLTLQLTATTPSDSPSKSPTPTPANCTR